MSIESYLIVFMAGCWLGLSHVPNLQIRLPFPFIGFTAFQTLVMITFATVSVALILWRTVINVCIFLDYNYLLSLAINVFGVNKKRGEQMLNFDYSKNLILHLCCFIPFTFFILFNLVLMIRNLIGLLCAFSEFNLPCDINNTNYGLKPIFFFILNKL